MMQLKVDALASGTK